MLNVETELGFQDLGGADMVAEELTPQAQNAAEKKEELRPELEGSGTYSGAENRAGGIIKTRYSHEAMAEIIIANPEITQRQIALQFGRTEGWISRVINSDAFRHLMHQKKKLLVDPIIMAQTEERFRAIINRSADLLQDKIETANMDGLLKSVEVSAKVLGYGVAKGPGVQINNNFVVALPGKAASSEEWAKKYGNGVPIDVEVTKES